METHSSILAWKIPRQRSPAGSNPWGRKESNTIEHTYTHACTQLVLKSYLPFYPNFSGSLNPTLYLINTCFMGILPIVGT